MAVVYCHCANAASLDDGARLSVLAELCRSGRAFLATADLCGLCAMHGKDLSDYLSGGGLLAACRPRALTWLMEFAGPSRSDVKFLDMTSALSHEQITSALGQLQEKEAADSSSLDPGADVAPVIVLASQASQAGLLAAILSRGLNVLVLPRLEELPQAAASTPKRLVLGNFGESFPPAQDGLMFLDMSIMDEELAAQAAEMSAASAAESPAGEGGQAWLPWFPVIDYGRCSQCGQCRNFCLFGVYGEREGRVAVVNPSHCKPHCPACARVCPRCAIMFPKYTQEPINGSEVRPEHLSRQVHPTDLSAMMQCDVQEMLKERQIRNSKSEIRNKSETASTKEETSKEEAPGEDP